MVYTVPHYIGGKLYTESTPEFREIKNPAIGETIGRVDFATIATCNHAVATAKKAWQEWSQTPPVKRARILFKFRDLLEKINSISHELSLVSMEKHWKIQRVL